MTRRFIPRPGINPTLRGVRRKPGTQYCNTCNRSDLFGRYQSDGLAFHYSAPPCMLPCAGGSLANLEPEDKHDGIHGEKNCPRCHKARRSA